MKPFSVVIIGLGQISVGYDLQSPPETYATHTKAILSLPGFELLGGVDPSPDKRAIFERVSGKPAWDALPATIRPDVIVIATPSPCRLPIIREALALSPKLLLVEKPIAMSVREANEILSLTRGTPLFVNYIRRTEPAVIDMKRLIESRHLGELKKIHGVYNRGLINSASHYIDMLSFLLGTPSETRALGPVTASSPDSVVDFELMFNSVSCVFQGIPESNFFLGEIEFYFSGGILNYRNQGRAVDMRLLRDDPHLPGRLELSPSSDIIPVRSHQYQLHVFNHLYDHLTTQVPLASTGETALTTLSICEKLLS